MFIWKEKVLQRCEENLQSYRKKTPHIARAPFKMCAVIKRLKEFFVIAPVDKAQHNLSIICKRYYLYILSKELGSKAYSTISDCTIQEIMNKHKIFNNKYKHEHIDNLSYLYWIAKFHKNPPKPRFIAGVSNTYNPTPNAPLPHTLEGRFLREVHKAKNSTTAASTYLSRQLQIVMKLLQQKDQQLFEREGYRRCWFIRSVEEVYLEIKANQDYLNIKRPRTFDFTTMYTNLEHERIIANVRSTIQEAHKYIREVLSLNEQTKYKQLLKDEDTLMDHVVFIVKNTFLCTKGGVLRHQRIGLLMGTNSAPELANLTLYHDESQFIDNFVKQKQIEKAKEHCFNFRLIDDILTWNGE